MHDVEELCDRVAFIINGKIKIIDSPKSLQRKNSNTTISFSYIKDDVDIEKIINLEDLLRNEEFIDALANNSVYKIHSNDVSMEDVFVELTGRCLE